ncbi:TonB-dependent receptor [Emcibacter nanhaiensis]|nr:TonB-dependent receptor [Emcibacter nanhaiensis]
MATPFAVTALQSDHLFRSGVDSLQELRTIVSSIQFSKNSGANIISIRGIGAELLNIGAEPGVTVNQDGVPLSSPNFYDIDFLDVEHVEILRGPQGTVNGRNATGGAINIYSKRPTNEFEAGAKLSLGNYNHIGLEGYISGPILHNKVRGRLAIKSDRADGWLHNSFLNKDIATKDRIQLRGILETNLSDTLETTLIVGIITDNSVKQGTFELGRIRPDVPSLGEFYGVKEVDPDKLILEADQISSGNKKQVYSSLGLRWAISPSISLLSTTSYIDLNDKNSLDTDGTRLSVTQFPELNYDVWQLSQELTLSTNLTDRLDLIMGGLYLRQNAREPIHFVSELVLGLAPGLFIDTPENNLSSYSAYAQLRYQLTDKFQLSAGVRYTYDWKSTKEAITRRDENASFSAWTPRFAVDYTATEMITLYGSISKGFKSGGFNTFQLTFGPYQPETVWSYEVGSKLKLFDNRIFMSAAAFYADYTGIQQHVFGLDGSFLPTVLNAGKAEIKGIEIEINALVTDNFRLDFAGSYLNAKLTELRTADTIFPELGKTNPATGLNIQNLSGNMLPRSPEFKVSMSGEYSHSLNDDLTATLRVEYTWQDKVYFSVFNHEGTSQGAYGLLNLYASLESEDSRWVLSASAQNLLDQRYLSNAMDISPGTTLFPRRQINFGEPRMYQLTLAFKL